MENYGFLRVASAVPSVRVADCEYNTDEIIRVIDEAETRHVSVIVFPETCITSYTAQDLFLQRRLLDEAAGCLDKIREKLTESGIVAIVGMPLEIESNLYNVGVVVGAGKIWGVVPKTFMPNYNEFYDKRWFSSSCELKVTDIELCGQTVPVGTDILFKIREAIFGIELCEDLWTPVPPSSIHTLNGAEIIFNLSASNETTGKYSYRKQLISQQSARCIAAYVYSSAGNGESTTDLVFSGSSIIAEYGTILAEGERFSFESCVAIADIDVERIKNDRLKNKSFTTKEYDNFGKKPYRKVKIEVPFKCSIPDKNGSLLRTIEPHPFVPSPELMDERCSEIFSIQVGGLAKRMLHTQSQKAVIGVSGGLDSTLALLVIVKTFDKLGIGRENIVGITMPGFGTTDRTYTNAVSLMRSLGVTVKEIPIRDAVLQHFKDIGQNKDTHDITYENSQARERTQILMDYANKINGLVIGTGDLSELALGWATYNGDHMSMYGVNSSIPKTLVRTLVGWVSATQMPDEAKYILDDIMDTPISPELLPAKNGTISQITEETVGPYELHDFFLYNMIRFGFEPKKNYYLACHAFKNLYGEKIILKWLKVFYRRFFAQQFKRSCMPDGPKVGSINLSPRGDWRMPSDASATIWLKQLDAL